MILQVVKDIKSLKIQGAQNVAIEAVRAIKELVIQDDSKTPKLFLKKIQDAKEKLVLARVTEPCLRNGLNYCTHNIENLKSSIEIAKNVAERADFVLEHFANAKKKMIEYGVNKIFNGAVIYTHCHSSSVVDILVEAKRQGKKFTVHNTETRPLFQGRKTATELAAAGIRVEHFVDSSARIALKNVDIAFLGCDAITTDRIINKIGSELFMEVAEKYDILTYVCTDSWKFDALSIHGVSELIEERSSDEVWIDAPKGVIVRNFAFEKIHPKHITGIITELGVYPHDVFIEEVKRNYPYLL